MAFSRIVSTFRMCRPASLLTVTFRLCGLAAILATCVWAVGCEGESPPDRSTAADTTTTARAKYVGDQTCDSCHSEIHSSFHKTGMGRSLSRFDPAKAPEEFRDSTSRAVYDETTDLCYQAFVHSGDLYQREYRVN